MTDPEPTVPSGPAVTATADPPFATLGGSIDHDRLFFTIYKAILAAAATIAGASLIFWLFSYMLLATATK